MCAVVICNRNFIRGFACVPQGGYEIRTATLALVLNNSRVIGTAGY